MIKLPYHAKIAPKNETSILHCFGFNTSTNKIILKEYLSFSWLFYGKHQSQLPHKTLLILVSINKIFIFLLIAHVCVPLSQIHFPSFCILCDPKQQSLFWSIIFLKTYWCITSTMTMLNDMCIGMSYRCIKILNNFILCHRLSCDHLNSKHPFSFRFKQNITKFNGAS